MILHLISYGKIRTPGLRETCDHYAALLKTWLRVEEIELKPAKLTDRSESTRRIAQAKEGQSLLNRLMPRESLLLLDEAGETLPTTGWADRIRGWEKSGVRYLAIGIGSPTGFGEEVRARASHRISFGPQTFSRDLARAVALEQLYRAWSVVRGHPYHVSGS